MTRFFEIGPNKQLLRDWVWNESKFQAHDYLLKSIDRVLDKLDVPKASRILDVGCGGGYVMHEFYRKGYKNVWGFDISEGGIKISKNNFPEIEERYKIHDAYDRNLPESFPSGGYDLALSVEVIEHLYSPRTYLENINYWLKPGGYLIITTPYNGYLKNLMIGMLNKFDLHFNPIWEGGHIKFFSRNTLYLMLEAASFKPVRFLGSGRFPYLWKSMVVLAQKG